MDYNLVWGDLLQCHIHSLYVGCRTQHFHGNHDDLDKGAKEAVALNVQLLSCHFDSIPPNSPLTMASRQYSIDGTSGMQLHLIARAKSVLEMDGGTNTAQAAACHDSNSVPEDICLFHAMSCQNNCSACSASSQFVQLMQGRS